MGLPVPINNFHGYQGGVAREIKVLIKTLKSRFLLNESRGVLGNFWFKYVVLESLGLHLVLVQAGPTVLQPEMPMASHPLIAVGGT